jgi:hypothetical protein
MSDAHDPAPVALAESTDSPRRRHLVGDPLPAVCELKDVGELLGLGSTRVWELYQAHAFDFALLQPAVGNKPRFSGKKLQAWSDGELEVDASATRHFFGGRAKRR